MVVPKDDNLWYYKTQICAGIWGGLKIHLEGFVCGIIHKDKITALDNVISDRNRERFYKKELKETRTQKLISE